MKLWKKIMWQTYSRKERIRKGNKRKTERGKRK